MKWKNLVATCTLGILASCSSVPKSSSSFEWVQTLKPVDGLVIHEYKHKSNGLHVYLMPGHAEDAVAFVTAFDVGSRDEDPGKTGLAHLFEHMMFRGTESYPDPFKTLASWGADYNAYTGQDQTVYYEYFPSSVLDDVIKFEAERMRHLLITPEIFNTERGAVVSERKLNTEDRPFGRLFWELYLAAFDQHTYKYTPIGRQADLDKMTFDQALDFYKKHYAPNYARIAIAGDFSISNALNLLDKNYGSFKAVELARTQPPAEKLIRTARRKVIKLKTENALIADAVFAPSIKSNTAAAELLYCIMLSNSDIGYLRYELIEKGLATAVGASCTPSKDPGLSFIYIQGNNGVSPQKLEAAYDKAVKGFANWLTDERLEKIKVYFMSSNWSSLRSPMHLAQDVATNSLLAGDPLYDFHFNEEIMKLTKKDILKRMQERQTLGHTRIVIQPSSKSDPFK